jgi:hypothetical protein
VVKNDVIHHGDYQHIIRQYQVMDGRNDVNFPECENEHMCWNTSAKWKVVGYTFQFNCYEIVRLVVLKS